MDHSSVVIELTQGYVAIISMQDYERVKNYSWHIHRSAGTKKKEGQPYARSNINGKKVYLHRFIVNAGKGYHVDHKNFQTLDNRRTNLENLPPKENICRRRNCPAGLEAAKEKLEPTFFGDKT